MFLFFKIQYAHKYAQHVHKTPDAKRRKADCDHAMSAEEIQEARIALRTGFVNLHLTKCVFIGPPGVGKTHTQKLLCGLPLPEARKSTALLERPVITTLYFNGDQCKSSIVDSSIMLDFLSTQIKEFLNNTKCTKNQDLVVDKQPSGSLLLAVPKMSEDSHRTQAHIRVVEEERLKYEKELLQRVSKLQMEPTEVLLTTDWMICLDSGGQPQFHRLLPTFVNDLDVALYVLKLNEKLDDYPKIEWYNNGKLHGEAYSYSYTNEWMLKRTIQGLTSMRNPPSIVFVGTHRDLEHECDETIADKNTKLKSILLPNFKKHLLPYNTTNNDVVFPINCQCPGSEDNAVMVKLKAVISKRINSIPIRLKLSDLFLGLEIKALAERKGHSLVSKVDCLEIGNSLGLSQDEVNDAIKFLSKCNLLYYNAFVPDIVFCDLQIILSNITNFVKKTHELHDLTFETTELITHGQFSDDVIDSGLATDLFVDGLFCKYQYIDLLEHLGVISVIKDKPHKLYFMPSLLKEVSPLQLENVKRSCIGCAQPIILFYEKGWPTSGTYCTLVARLLSRDDWKITEKDSTPICLFSNCIQLSFLDKNIQGSCLITIIDCVQYIELNVVINDAPNASGENCEQLYRTICAKVLRIVEHNLSGNTANGRVHTTFMCPCSKPATLKLEKSILKCSRDFPSH